METVRFKYYNILISIMTPTKLKTMHELKVKLDWLYYLKQQGSTPQQLKEKSDDIACNFIFSEIEGLKILINNIKKD